jgi:hypothetical protein
MGFGCTLQIRVDTQPVADLRTSEWVVLHLPVGDHVLSVKDVEAYCGLGVGIPELQVTVKEDRPLTIRLDISHESSLIISPTAYYSLPLAVNMRAAWCGKSRTSQCAH